MNEIKINYVVKFKDNATSLAAKFCHDQGLVGVVVGIEQSRYVINAGLGYNIYAPYGELEIVQEHSSGVILQVPESVLKLAPPNDDYQN